MQSNSPNRSRFNSLPRLPRAWTLPVLLLMALASPAVNGQSLYWDSNGTTTGAGATPFGNWGTDLFWSTDPNGELATAGWTSGATAVFSAGADASGEFTVNIAANQTVGALLIEEGTVHFTNTAIVVGTGNVTVNAGATLSTDSSLRISATAGATLTVNGGTLRTTNPGAAGTFYDQDFAITLGPGGGTFSHVTPNILNIVQTATTIVGPGGLIKTGAGVLAIAGTGTYLGSTIINDGELRIRTTANRLPVTTAVIVNDPGILNLNSVAQQIGSLSGNGRVGLGSATLMVGDASDTIFTGSISNYANAGASGVTTGAGRITKTGTGSLTLAGSNAYTGSLTVSNGTVTAAPGSILCDPLADIIVHGGTLNLSNTAQTILTLSGSNGTVNLGTGHTLTVNPSTSRNFFGTVAGDGALTKSGGGTLVLVGNNTYEGPTTINAGAIQAASATALGNTTPTTVASGASVLFDGAASAFTIAEPLNVAGTGSGTLGSAIFVQNNANITLSGPVTLTGDATIGVSGTGTALYNNANAITALANQNLTLQGGSGAGGGGTISGTISLGTGGLTKLQGGRWTLTAPNTYSGPTLVSAGTLRVANTAGSATGSGDITVSPGATLSGPGTIAGAVNLSGTIAPGASPGTQNTGSQIWNSGATYVWEANDVDAGQGTDPGWDLINITGSLTINATPASQFTIDITSLTPANAPGNVHDFDNTSDYVWTILKTTGGITGFDTTAFNLLSSNFSNPLGLGFFTIELANAGNDLQLRFNRALAITAQPVNQSAECATGTATFGVTADGVGPFAYQWRFNGVDIGGATAAALVINPTTTATAGNYDVVVTNIYGAVTSTVAALTLIDTVAPIITTCAPNQIVNADATCQGVIPDITALVTATDTCSPVTITQSPTAGTQLPVGTHTITLSAKDAANNEATCTATLTIPDVSPPTFTVCAPPQTVTAGGAACQAAIPDLTGLATATDTCPGAVTITQSPAAGTLVAVGVHTVTLTAKDAANNEATCQATVTVNSPVTVTVNSPAICPSGTAILTATHNATTPSYLWSPGGETTPSITVTPASTTTYTVTVTDAATTCSGTGSGTVTVNAALVVTVNSPTICPGDSATLTATTAASNPTFLWSPGGETTPSIIVSPVSTATYTVLVTDDSGCTGNGSGTVTVRAPQTFANTGGITINDFAAATPYPSVINVSGLTSTVCRVAVTLHNITHAFPDDIDIVLIAPNGQGVLLMSDVGGANPASSITLTLDDSASGNLPDASPLTSGSYKPTNIGAKSDNRPDNFPAPVPAVNFVTNLAALAGADPNGAWSLYIFDDELVDTGSMAGGWSLDIITLTPFADLAVAQAPIPNPVAVGSNLTFNITVSNLGPAGADAVSLSDTLPAGMTFVSATPSQGSCSESLGVVNCALGTIAANASATITITVTPTGAGAVANTASVTSSTLDFVIANNTSTANVTVLDPPVILTGPANQTACTDHTASFAVTATGAAPLSYQWYLNDVAISGATAATYTIASAQAADAGTYKVIVTNPVGAAEASATLVVSPLPTVAINSETICLGQSATLTATTSAANPSYLWTPGGATTASITVSPGSTTIYTVLVTDGATGCTNSASATITVKALTTATALTSITDLCPGSPASFSTTASGEGPFTYAWRKDGVLLGETSATLSIASVATTDAGTYTVEVTGFCNTVTNGATLTIAAPPAITAQPQNQTSPMGNNATFSVTATGVGPIAYQWRLNGVDIPGATGTSITLSNLTLSQSGQSYSVAASNCGGTTLSAAAVLTVTPITGIAFDFNTPGQYSNAPFNLKNNHWMSSAIVNGLNNPMIPTVPFEVPALQPNLNPGYGTTPSGALDLAFNNGTDHGNTLLPVNYDFSLHGKTLVASIMMKIKVPTANQRATQIGFITSTNVGNAWMQIQSTAGLGFMSAILQSTIQPAPGYMLRAQFKPLAGTTATETQPINNPTNLLATNNWYRLVARFVNIKDTTANTYTVETSLQDMGADGQTPGAIVLAYPPQNQVNADLVNARNLYFCIRGFENGGIDFWDNVYIHTTNGPIYFVQQPPSQSIPQGRQITLRAHVDGDGPYTYQWNKNGTPIPGAGTWTYTTPPLLLSDDQAQYTITVTGPANTITSDPAVVTVQAETLNVVSAGSVDGSSIGLRFDQPVDRASAETAANYTINGTPAWTATLRDNGSDVLLVPAAPISGPFTVTVQNVLSLSGTAIGAGNSASGATAGLTGYDLNPLSVGANGQVSTIPGENHSFGPDAFDIKGGGHDIFGNFDGFRFVHRLHTGDFDVRVRIPHQDLLRTPNKAGFAVRPSLDPFGPNIFAGVNPMLPGRNFYEGTVRQGYNVATGSWGNNTACAYPNTWLRFRRVGNTFMRYSSTNGINWLFDGQTSPTPAFPETVYFGFAVCANVGGGNLQQMIRAEFDNYGEFSGYPGASITITEGPTNVTVSAGSVATLTAFATVAGGIPAGELAYIWQRENGSGGWTNLPTAGATNNTVSTGTLYGADNGAQYRVIVSAPGAASVTSAVAVVTVTDSAAPTVATSVFPTNSLNQLLVTFNENVSAATALNPANYTVTNGAGTVFPVASVVFLGGDPRVVLITTADTLPAGTYGVRITGVQDLGGNTIAATTRTFSQQPAPALAPIVVDIYTGLHNSGADILTLTTNIMFVNDTPSFTVYSNVFGINPLNANFPDTLNNYGVRMYTWFVPPTSGAYKFYVRADDFAELWMNTNAVNSTTRAGATLQLALTGNQQAYTAPNSRTNTLVGGQRYYIELRFKESTGGDGGTVAVRTDNTVPGQGEVIPGSQCVFPDTVAPATPVVAELYTGQVTVNSLAVNDVGAAFGSGGYPDLLASANTINFIAGLPNVVGYEKAFAFKQDLREAQASFDNYMGRMYSYFVAPSNGLYRFYIRHDDSGELWMNTNAVNSTDPAGMALMGFVTDFYDVNYRVAAQNVSLIGGQRYYIESRWREGGGGDGMTVAVRAQGDFALPPTTESIPGALLEFPTNLARIGQVSLAGITPSNPTVNEGQSVTFIAKSVSGTAPYGFVWFKNGQQVHANAAFYVTPPLTAADHDAVFSLVVTNIFGTATRSSTVSVVTDTTAPSIVSAVASAYGESILVTFDEPVEPFTAQSLAHYRINGLSILGADWDEVNRSRVSLRTAPLAANATYTLVVNGVRDTSAAGNAIVNGTATVSTLVAGGQGAVLVEVFTNVPNTSVDWLFADPRYIHGAADISYYTNQFSFGFFQADTGINNYGVRVSGVFLAPSNGLYRFFVRGDDGTRLYMNTNGPSPAGRVLIARNDGANSASNLVMNPQLSAWQTGIGLGSLGASVSPIVSLTGGGAYYMEALMKEGGGGDHLEVLMRAIDPNTLTEIGGLPFNAAVTDAIPGSFFGAPGSPDQNRLVILQSPPASLSVAENDTVTLEVSATTVPISILYTLGFQWQKNNGSGFVNIPGQNQPAYVFDAALADDDAQYRVIVSIPGTNVAYTTTLNVSADSNPPRLIAASSLDGMSIGVCFSERVTAATAGDNFNYVVNGGAVLVVAAQARPDGRSAVIFLNSPVSGTFTVEATAIDDSAGASGGGIVDGVVQGFAAFDVGAPAQPGSSFSCALGAMDVIAGGADIWGASDQGHLTLSPRYGDFDVHARVHALSRVDAIAKAGLMVRENSNANSRVFHHLVNPPVTDAGRDLGEAALRPGPGATTALVPGSASYYPVGIPDAWVRIKRSGNVYTTYRGWDGVNWIEVAQTSLGFGDPVWIGLGTTAHNNAAPATLALYRDVHIPPTPIILVQPAPASQSVALGGSVSYSVVASNPPGSGPLVYQWKRDGVSIPGANGATLNLTGVQGAQAGSYSVWVGNDGGATISSSVLLSVLNQLPVAGTDNLSTPQDVPLVTPVGALLANDSDAEGAPVSIVAVSGLPPISFVSDFNSGLPAGAVIFGNATAEPTGGAGGSGHIRLHPGAANQAGSLILDELSPRRRVSAFSASFKLRVADGSTEPADGFSFNFAPDLTIGTSTGAENGVGTGLSLCVDNYRFAPVPVGGTANTSGVKLRFGGGDVAFMRTPTWDRDAWVPVSVSVSAEGKVNVFIDGTNVFGEVSVPWVPRVGRFGFYGRTGGQFQSHGIDDLSITTLLTVETAREANLGGAVFGNAYVDNGFLHLTDAANSVAGSFIVNDLSPGVAATAFSASFKLRIGNGSAEPADGFSFNFASDLPIGATTPAAAENGGGTGFSFCVDNYRFDPYPTGGTVNSSGMKIRYGGVDIAGVRIPTWNSTVWVPVSITLASDGTLTVLVDGTNVFGAITLPWTPTMGRFGLYGRTGGQNETHWVDDLAINVTTAGSPASFAANFSGGGFGTVVLNGGMVTYTPPSGACGTDRYYYLASDGQAGGTSMGTVNVDLTVANPQPPMIVACAAARTLEAGANCQVALPDLTASVGVSDCATFAVLQSPAAGTLVGLGSTVVTLTVSNSYGLTATCQTTVMVQDTTPPALVSCPLAALLPAGPACTVIMPDLTAQFVVDDACAVSVTQNPPAGSVLPLGITMVTLTATDLSGNATNCVTSLTIMDMTPPAIICPANITTACTGTNGATVSFSATATDNCSASPAIVCTPASGSVFPQGVTTVSCVAQDTAGNTNTCTFTVTITDPVSPVLTITRSGTDVVISWPQSCTVWVLEETLALGSGAVWTPVTTPVQAVGATYQVTLPATTANRFYQLKK